MKKRGLSQTSILLLRLLVGGIFLSEGMQKFFITSIGVQRFASIGFPEQMAYIVGTVEIISALCLLSNRFVKQASIALIIIMTGVLTFTKLPLLLDGFFTFAHESRTDLSMLIGSIILLIEQIRK